jgi:hypothetical protein
MALFMPLAALLWLKPAYRTPQLGPMLGTWLVLFLAAPLVVGAISATGPWLGARPQRSAWPGPTLAAEATRAWHDATGKPLGIVAGDTWESGLVSAYSADRPSVFVEADPRFNPWIDPARISREGVLAVWQGGAEVPPPYDGLGPFAATGTVEAPFARADGPKATLHWAARPPAE